MTQPVDEDERLYTSGQVASLFNAHVRTIARWARSGRLSSVRTPGGHHRFFERDVQALYALEREAIELKVAERAVVVEPPFVPTRPHNFAVRLVNDAGQVAFRCIRQGCAAMWLPKTPRPQSECIGIDAGGRP
jgi:excisionase family DNA binding protein